MATGRRRGRAIIYIALILILLLVLVFALMRLNLLGTTPTAPAGGEGTSAQAVATPTEVQEVENIIVTTQNVRRGQELTDELLAVVTIPREQYTEGVFFKDKAEVIGARAKIDLKAHTPVTN